MDKGIKRYRRKSNALALVLLIMLSTIISVVPITESKAVNNNTYEEITVYRLYNPYTGEHFYTDNLTEKNHLVSISWSYEGISFIASDEGTAVYRLFNPYSSEHHYTLDKNEKNVLCLAGWNDEGIGWYSVDTGSSCEKKLYRLFNPYASTMTHHYTLDENEKNTLVNNGWIDEGTCWTSLHSIIYHDAVMGTISSDGYNACALCGEVFDNGNEWKEPFYQHYHDLHGFSYTGAEVVNALENQYDWIECDYEEYMDAEVSKADDSGYYIGIDNHRYDAIIEAAYNCISDYQYVGAHDVPATIEPAYYQCNACGQCTRNDGMTWDYVPPQY